MIETRATTPYAFQPLPLLATKLYFPHLRSDLVQRPQLVTRLRASLRHPLTLICAPAGSGKTTLLGEWYASLGNLGNEPGAPLYRPAWVALDEGDNDPARFWRYVAAAFEQTQTGSGTPILSLLESPQQPPLELLLTTLLNALATPTAESTGAEIVLTLDDYHVITEQAIHEGIAFLLGHLPPSVHLIIASRATPPLPLARLRARNQLGEFSATDLRFTSDEATAFLQRLPGVSLSVDDIAALEQRTEGWVAGLQLAALSLQGAEDIPAQIAAFGGANRLVLDYVTEEVLRRQPATVQRFLLHTSILERFCAQLCNAVTGDSDGQETLETLERSNLFLIPLDGERRWYRYHHLFAGLLRRRLELTLPEAMPQLHSRAAIWHQQNGQLSDAVEHALAGGDDALAAQLIATYFLTMLERSEMVTVRRWLDALPQELLKTTPHLSLIYAWVLLAIAHFTEIEPHLRAAEQALDMSTGQPENAFMPASVMRGHIDAIRATIAINTGNKPLAKDLAERALASLPDDEPLPRTLAALDLADALYGLSDTQTATQAFIAAYEASVAAGMTPITLNALSNLGQLYESQGKLRQAAATYELAIAIAGEQGGMLHFSSKSHVGLAHILRERNELAAAREQAQQGITYARQWGHQEHLIDGYICLANIQWAEGDREGALAILAETELLVRKPSAQPEVVMRFLAYRAECWIRLGMFSEAEGWAESFDASMESMESMKGNVRLRMPGYGALVRLRLAQGDPLAARTLLERLRPIAEQLGLGDDLIRIDIGLALTYEALHQHSAALAALRRSVELAAPEDYRRTFWDEGAPLAALLKALPPGLKEGAYIRMLLAGFTAPPSTSQGKQSAQATRLIEPLSRREQEVLRLIAAGASNQEIAASLVIALGTVKKHITTIFAKVGVASRTQLLVRARELGLLD
jgi:LuxR family maltose regulon positive regulatory protein